MEIGEMFQKRIDRDIKGVIKIGQEDDANVLQELEEYVVTKELRRHFSTFFASLKKGITSRTDEIGVWISGFFGSGKSHFLKILSYLLENKEVAGKKAVTFFEDKIGDPLVLADMKLTGDISADIIMFDIDSKHDSTSNTNKELIVRVFNKVFNEAQGFCGPLPWLAELEKRLSQENTYGAFKRRFKELVGYPWEEKREDFYFEEEGIVRALADTTKMSEEAARNWYYKAEENYSLSIEKFARRVKEYIDSKGKEHYVIFLVDEMGQYIGGDVGLMLNLQTIVQDLGTFCDGKAWVIVTSQQDIDAVTRVKGNDFSKIQGRFNTRLSLSSANVDEVIKRRLLHKNKVARDTLDLLYSDKEALLKNLITFSADTPEMKTYKAASDLVKIYPFIPYHFRLLQAVFTAVRQHGASGKHLSEGERSLLSAFQEAAIKYMKEEVGALVPFSAFYETIETFLDHDIRTVFIHAEDNDKLQDLDLEVLKVLFLIKWVKEMPANLENIATLLICHIDEDKLELKKKIAGSLDRLVKETLIQKNGPEYIFLTHEEQDVNKEIQNIPIDMEKIILKIGSEIYTGIYSEKKYRYNVRYYFDFNKIIDDRLLSTQKYDIGVKVITPYYDIGEELSDSALKMMSVRENNLIVKLPSDSTFLEEMEDALKIESYLNRKAGATVTEAMEEIRVRKSREYVERNQRVKDLLIAALGGAELYANGRRVQSQSKNPVERINAGLKILIEDNYNKLNYITEFVESRKELQDLAIVSQEELLTAEDIPNKLALDEINTYIGGQTQRHIPLTMKTVLDLYTKPPYGWLPDDIRGLVIKLFKGQEIRVQLGGDFLQPTDKNLIQFLTKKDFIDRLLIKKRIKTPEKYINNAKELSRQVFNYYSVPSDEDGLQERFQCLSRDELSQIRELLIRYEDKAYPGRDVLAKGKELFKEIAQIREPTAFFERVYEVRKELLAYDEDVFEVKKFFQNQKKQFDRALEQLYIFNQNKTYVLDKDTIEIIGEIEDIVKEAKPYSQIARLPHLIKNFNTKFLQLLEEECKPILAIIESDWDKVEKELAGYDIHDKLHGIFKGKFQDLLTRLKSTHNFYEAIAMREESERLKMRSFAEIKNAAAKRKGLGLKEKGWVTDGGVKGTYVIKKTINVSLAGILPRARTIEKESDIEELLEHIGAKLRAELKENTVLKLI